MFMKDIIQSFMKPWFSIYPLRGERKINVHEIGVRENRMREKEMRESWSWAKIKWIKVLLICPIVAALRRQVVFIRL